MRIYPSDVGWFGLGGPGDDTSNALHHLTGGIADGIDGHHNEEIFKVVQHSCFHLQSWRHRVIDYETTAAGELQVEGKVRPAIVRKITMCQWTRKIQSNSIMGSRGWIVTCHKIDLGKIIPHYINRLDVKWSVKRELKRFDWPRKFFINIM